MASFEYKKLFNQSLEFLTESESFERLITKVKFIWDNDKVDYQPNHDVKYQAEQTLANISQQRTKEHAVTEPQVIEKVVEKIVEVPVEKIIEVKVPVEKIVKKEVEIPVLPKWATDLEQQYQYLQQLRDFPTLHAIFNHIDFESSTAILQFISCASQWTNIVRIWEEFAEECKASQQPISQAKLAFLDNCIYLFNLNQNNSLATLVIPNVGDSYDYKQHTQVSGSGNKVLQVLLAGLKNGAGEKVKSALIIC